jgi:hypothetical protein
VRVADTRDGGGARLPAGGVLQVTVAPGSSAALINVAVTDPGGSGYLTVYPCGSAIPATSNVNYGQGNTIANLVLTALDGNGRACIYTQTAAHIVVDRAGSFTSGVSVSVVGPTRLIDTRSSVGVVPGGQVLQINVRANSAVPADSTGVLVNVTAVDQQAGGYVTVYPCGQLILASNVNFIPGRTVANLASTPIHSSGNICLYVSSTTHLIVDLAGAWRT